MKVIPAAPKTEWLEHDPAAPIVGFKTYGDRTVMFRIGWEMWPLKANEENILHIPRSGILMQLLLEVPLIALNTEWPFKLRFNHAVDILVAPWKMLPRKGRRIVILDSRALAMGFDTENVMSLTLHIDSPTRNATAWLGRQTAHLLVP